MPYCANCKIEYREGFTVCSDCGALLVDDNPMSEGVAKEIPVFDDTPVFLCSLEDGYKADIVLSLLESFGIPVLIKRRGAGKNLSNLMGGSLLGSVFSGKDDVYVPAKLLATAREIIQMDQLPG